MGTPARAHKHFLTAVPANCMFVPSLEFLAVNSDVTMATEQPAITKFPPC